MDTKFLWKLVTWITVISVICLTLFIWYNLAAQKEFEECNKKIAATLSVEPDKVGRELETQIDKIMRSTNYASGMKQLSKFGRVTMLEERSLLEVDFAEVITINPCKYAGNGYRFIISSNKEGEFTDVTWWNDD
jgi:hypothetical protein